MSARRAASSALAGLFLCMGCATKTTPAPPATTPASTARDTSTRSERASCPRVERARRMWSGFLVDVPSEAMVQALDVVVPIQVALGELFCASERADCRPSELQAIDLSDEHAKVALVRVLFLHGDGPRELSLTLQAENETWSAQPESLAQYLALCRQGRVAEPEPR